MYLGFRPSESALSPNPLCLYSDQIHPLCTLVPLSGDQIRSTSCFCFFCLNQISLLNPLRELPLPPLISKHLGPITSPVVGFVSRVPAVWLCSDARLRFSLYVCSALDPLLFRAHRPTLCYALLSFVLCYVLLRSTLHRPSSGGASLPPCLRSPSVSIVRAEGSLCLRAHFIRCVLLLLCCSTSPIYRFLLAQLYNLFCEPRLWTSISQISTLFMSRDNTSMALAGFHTFIYLFLWTAQRPSL
jgi:hypothetical protein